MLCLTYAEGRLLIVCQDAFDFFTVSLTVSDLAETFDKTTSQITWGITLVLMFRSVGAILFGKRPRLCSKMLYTDSSAKESPAIVMGGSGPL